MSNIRPAAHEEEVAVGTKDKGGTKASKKPATKSVKEKRQAKKNKKAGK